MGLSFERRILILEIYAGMATAAFCVMCLCGFQQGRTKFDEIDVQRLNVVEPDGQLRAVIANSARMPDPIVQGRSFKTERPPGLIFYNGLGDECGGLVFGAVEGKGQYGAFGGLMFDQYRQSQTLGMMYNDHNGQVRAGYNVWDRPETSGLAFLRRQDDIDKMPSGPVKTSAKAQLVKDEAARPRVFMGKTKERDATVTLSDAQGRPRINLVVTAAGAARIEFLDEPGKVTKALDGSR